LSPDLDALSAGRYRAAAERMFTKVHYARVLLVVGFLSSHAAQAQLTDQTQTQISKVRAFSSRWNSRSAPASATS
jgi:hypothetical protein